MFRKNWKSGQGFGAGTANDPSMRLRRIGGFLASISLTWLAIVPISSAAPNLLVPGTIATMAGTGEQGYSGDGGPAIAANLNSPQSLAIDPADNWFIEDGPFDDVRVRRVDNLGTITTVAGGGTSGTLGDGGPATSVSLGRVTGIAADSEGLYIAASEQKRIRKVDSSGIITTVAGNGQAGYSGDGGPATDAKISAGYIAVDLSGNIYFTGGYRLRKVDSQGIITTVAGTGESAWDCWAPHEWHLCSGDGGPAIEARIIDGPLAADRFGNIYLAGPNRIRKIDPAGNISTVAGYGSFPFLDLCAEATGYGDMISIGSPTSIATDALGVVYFTQSGRQSCVMRVTSGVVSPVAGFTCQSSYYNSCWYNPIEDDGYPALLTNLRGPRHVVVSSTLDVYFTHPSHRVRMVVEGKPPTT